LQLYKKLGIFVIALVSCLLAGCKGERKAIEDKVTEYVDCIELKAVTIGEEPKEGMEELYKELDALTIPELNCKLRFEFIPWGDEREQINMAIASGEYDFIPGGVFSDYRVMATRNAFLDLNQYLNLVPDLVAHYTCERAETLEKCEINGSLYGIPQYSESNFYTNIAEGFFYREDLRKEWGLKPITNLDTMEAYLYRAKKDDRYANQPLITDNRVWTSLWYIIAGSKYLEVTSILETPFVVVSVDEPYIPVARMETPEFKEVLRYMKKWYDDGILASNLLVSANNEGNLALNLMKADRKPCETNAPIWSCNTNYIQELYDSHPEWEFGFYSYMINQDQIYAASGAGNSVISISSKTTNPDVAVKLLEKLHTDERYYNLLMYGVEGLHYNKTDTGVNYIGISEDSRYRGWTASSDETLNYNKTPSNEKWSKDVYEPYIRQSSELFKAVPYSELDSFSFDTSRINTIIENMNECKKRYFQPLLCGMTDDLEEDLEQANSKLEEAGFKVYMQDITDALAEYKKSKAYLK
jgi:ABC-type glycerol-3-phosphate transport system substrate-binding protein